MGPLLILIGFALLLNALSCAVSAETSIHQIYAQAQFITCAICICGGCIINALQDIRKELKKTPENNPDKENIN